MATITITKGYAGSGTGWTSGETVTPEKLNLAQTPTATLSAIETADLEDGAVTVGKLAATLDLTGKTVTLPATSVNAAALATSAVETAKINDAAVTAAKLSGAQSGGAPVFGVRAWVNLNGKNNTSNALSITATNRFIKGSGNVSSVLRNATGDYTINFTTALPSANYVVSGSIPGFAADNPTRVIVLKGTDAGASNKTTTSVTILVGSSSSSGGTLVDSEEVGVMVIG